MMWFKGKRDKVIKYTLFTSTEYDCFVPAKTVVPDWYRAMDKFATTFPPKTAQEHRATAKACMPFTEALISGYTMTLAYDVVVSIDNDVPEITWREGGDVVSLRSTIAEHKNNVPTPEGFYDMDFVWIVQAAFKVPSGYSFLLTHPLNRVDLPFFTYSGLVDGPFLMSAMGQIPFRIRKGFQGVIPQGTPIAQILPFKTEDWKREIDNSMKEEAILNNKRSAAVLFGWYKKTYWKRKSYK